MSQSGTPEQQLRRLATDDQLEMKLRRLASYVYGNRTGDKIGAASMLAVQPPGAGLDLAPTWLVAEATQHSKNEHQREERVHKAPGRGRGGKDKGKGDNAACGGAAPDGGTQWSQRGCGAGAGGRGGRGKGVGFRSVEHRNVEGVLWRVRGAFLNHSPQDAGVRQDVWR